MKVRPGIKKSDSMGRFSEVKVKSSQRLGFEGGSAWALKVFK
jgi:hypothetical protein